MMNRSLQLKKSCNELLPIFQVEGEKFYATKFKKFIEILSAAEDGVISEGQALSLFRDEFRALYTPHNGLGEFFVWRDEFDVRQAINLQIKNNLNVIWQELEL